MMGAYGLDLFTPEAVRESGKALSLSMLEIKDLETALSRRKKNNRHPNI